VSRSIQAQEAKTFFFEKKKQKTFDDLAAVSPARRA
jgi:hypothetical protein